MTTHDLSWTVDAPALHGPAFERFQTELAKYNGRQLQPRFPDETWREELDDYAQVTRAEGEYIEAVRQEISPLVAGIPNDVDGFIDWFEELKGSGPGQGDSLFPWLSEAATRENMLWFLTQEVAGEAGFDDLLAMTQVKMPVTAKLEMARNYWDEMGRGRDTAMHGPLLERLASYLDIDAQPDRGVEEVLRSHILGTTLRGVEMAWCAPMRPGMLAEAREVEPEAILLDRKESLQLKPGVSGEDGHAGSVDVTQVNGLVEAQDLLGGPRRLLASRQRRAR